MNVGIYGLGRFGAFWASQLATLSSLKVLAYNRNPERLTPSGVERVDLQQLMERSETIFLCCSISSLPQVLLEIAPWVRPGQIIADTCSVKVFPAKWMEESLPDNCCLLATHPMFGPDSGKGGVKGLPLVLSALRGGEKAFEQWKPLFENMGLSVQVMSPQEHDRVAAYSQGITHMLGRVLDSMGIQDHPIATQGFKVLLELKKQTCNDPWQLFLDMQSYNPFTKTMRRDFSRALDSIRASLDALDSHDEGV